MSREYWTNGSWPNMGTRKRRSEGLIVTKREMNEKCLAVDEEQRGWTMWTVGGLPAARRIAQVMSDRVRRRKHCSGMSMALYIICMYMAY